jgi:hypothetical protein
VLRKNPSLIRKTVQSKNWAILMTAQLHYLCNHCRSRVRYHHSLLFKRLQRQARLTSNFFISWCGVNKNSRPCPVFQNSVGGENSASADSDFWARIRRKSVGFQKSDLANSTEWILPNLLTWACRLKDRLLSQFFMRIWVMGNIYCTYFFRVIASVS